jgi:predicted esterase
MLSVYYPALCRAALPFAAVIHNNTIHELISKPVKKVPIFLFQGEDDEIVRIVTTKKKVAEIANRLKLKLYTYPNLGHEISTQMKADYSAIIDKMNK